MRNKTTKKTKQQQLSLVEKMILEMGGTVLTLNKHNDTFHLDVFALEDPEETEKKES